LGKFSRDIPSFYLFSIRFLTPLFYSSFFISHKRTLDADYNTKATNPTSAAPATEESLPPDWHASFDPQYQRNYYYNYSTEERTWTKPTWETQPVQQPTAPASALEDLPPSCRWETAIDTAQGKPYFYNHTTGETSWALPIGAMLLKDAKAISIPAGAGGNAAKRHREEEPEEGEVGNNAPHANTTTQISKATQQDSDKLTEIASVQDVEEENSEEDGSEEDGEEEGSEEESESEGHERLLPEGWEEAIDPATGMTYFYHRNSNVTQWEHPGGLPPLVGGVLDEGTGRRTKRTAPPARATAANPSVQQRAQRQPALDPMDPSSYSDTPRGGWGSGLGKDSAM
jgi:hypothetical protein